MTSAPKFASFNWMRDVADDKRISVIHRFVLVRLCLYRRDNRPGYDKIAEWLGVDRSTVFRAVDAGIKRGWLAPRAGHGGHVKHQFQFTFPVTKQSQRCDGSRRPNRRRKTTPKQPSQGTLQAIDVADEVLTLRNKTLSGECYALSLIAGERDALSRESDSCISGGRLDGAAEMVLDPTATVPPPNQKGSAEEELEIADPPIEAAAHIPNGAENGVVPLDQQRDWRALLELWDRGWASDNTPKAVAIARNAFAKACQEVTPDDILAAARTWIASADAARYLPQLAQWLAARGWEKPPPTKRGSRERQHRDRLPRSNGRKVDLTAVAFKMGGYKVGKNGKLYHPDGDKGSSFDWRASQ